MHSPSHPQSEHLHSWSQHATCCLSEGRPCTAKASASINQTRTVFALQNQPKGSGYHRLESALHHRVLTAVRNTLQESLLTSNLQMLQPEPGPPSSTPPRAKRWTGTAWKSCHAAAHTHPHHHHHPTTTSCCRALSRGRAGAGRGCANWGGSGLQDNTSVLLPKSGDSRGGLWEEAVPLERGKLGVETLCPMLSLLVSPAVVRQLD